MSARTELLTQMRTSAGLSQRGLAARARVAQSTVTRIEAGRMEPTLDMLERLAAAAGQKLTLTVVPVTPTVAQVARTAVDDQPDWTATKALLDWIAEHPDDSVLAIALPPQTRSPRIANLLAAVAEKVADDHRLPRPAWATKTAPLEQPWEHPGTPKMVAASRAAAPEQFQARNIWLAENALWRQV